MIYTIKNILLLFLLGFLLESCVYNPAPDDCEVVTIDIAKIYEGGVKDIVFADEKGHIYYINRGLEQGYTLQDMEENTLNKKAILHIANTLIGKTHHIAQLKVEDSIYYTEFK